MAAVKWTPALAAAVIDVELAGKKPEERFSRDHVIALRNSGCTRMEVHTYLTSIFGNKKVRRGGELVKAVDHVMADLDGYGPWLQG